METNNNAGSGRQPRLVRDSLESRIRRNYRRGITYHELMCLTFPHDQFPTAWRYSHNGGPPGCAMAFGAALRRMGADRNWKTGVIYIPNAQAMASADEKTPTKEPTL